MKSTQTQKKKPVGRPLRDRSNRWHPSWRPVLECGMRRILASTSLPHKNYIEADELINVIWYRCMRRCQAEPGAQRGLWNYLNATARGYIAEYGRKAHAARANVVSLQDSAAVAVVSSRYDGYSEIELVDLVLALRRKLPARHRDILDWRLEGKTLAEIAATLEVSVETVRQATKQIKTICMEMI